jgi:hypothetical protein
VVERQREEGEDLGAYPSLDKQLSHSLAERAPVDKSDILQRWTERRLSHPDGQIEMLSDARHQIPWPMSALSNALDDTTLTMSERQRERQRVRVREERGG